MNVVVPKNILLAFLGKIQSVVSSKPVVPILANFLLEAVDDQLILTATDLTVSIRCFMEAKVVEEGAIALPARRFAQLVREVTAPQIKIQSHSGEIAEVVAGSSHFKIHGMSRAEFPEFPDLGASPKLSFESSHLKEMLVKTSFAAAKEDARYALNGIQLRIGQQTAVFTGTDGKRLARIASTVAIDPTLQGNYIVPIKAVEEMTRMLEEDGKQAFVTLSPDKLSLESNSVILTTKLLAGQYPDVEKVIPQKPVHQFSIHREELMSLLRQIALFTSETNTAVRFSFEPGQLHLSAMSSEIGEGRVSMPVDFTGQKIDIAFNPFYLLDILRHSKEETVRIGLTDPHSPGLITDSSQALFVLMPMRLGEVSTATDAS